MEMNISPPPRDQGLALTADSSIDVANHETARAVLRAPQDYALTVRYSACRWLMDHGDWLDKHRVQRLLPVVLQDLASQVPDDIPGIRPSKLWSCPGFVPVSFEQCLL